MSDLSAWLDAVQARADAATPGPWEWNGVTVSGPSRYATTWVVVDYGTAIADEPEAFDSIVADAAFIAAARTDVPAMVAALRAVVALHQPIPLAPDRIYCAVCKDPEGRAGVAWWPCPTAAALSSLTPDTPRSETP